MFFVNMFNLWTENFWLVVWLPFFEFSQKYWVANHPNWRSYFSEGFKVQTTNQIWFDQENMRVFLVIVRWSREHSTRKMPFRWWSSPSEHDRFFWAPPVMFLLVEFHAMKPFGYVRIDFPLVNHCHSYVCLQPNDITIMGKHKLLPISYTSSKSNDITFYLVVHPTNRVGGLVHPRYFCGRLAPTKIPLKSPGLVHPLTIRGMSHQVVNPRKLRVFIIVYLVSLHEYNIVLSSQWTTEFTKYREG